MPDPIRQTIHLPPTETVKFFRAKGLRILTSHWLDLWQEEHVRAFTVSKINDLTVLNAVYRELDTVVSKGIEVRPSSPSEARLEIAVWMLEPGQERIVARRCAEVLKAALKQTSAV